MDIEMLEEKIDSILAWFESRGSFESDGEEEAKNKILVAVKSYMASVIGELTIDTTYQVHCPNCPGNNCKGEMVTMNNKYQIQRICAGLSQPATRQGGRGMRCFLWFFHDWNKWEIKETFEYAYDQYVRLERTCKKCGRLQIDRVKI